jgi:ferritin-like metal-binding protein YciE
MSKSDDKVVQYLSEAHASELALVSVLSSQIAMTPDGSYRDALEKHLDETRTHVDRVRHRLGELGEGRNPFQALVGLSETMVGQMLALSKAPLDLLRGSSREEKVLKNAKDACATEQLEIATYTALERLAIKVGDEQTSKLAASIRRDEERMLKRVMLEIPKLTDAVVRSEITAGAPHETSEAVAADDARKVARRPRKTARRTRQASDRPKVETRRKRSRASAERLPIQRYRSLSTEEIISSLGELSESDLRKVDSYERKNKKRGAVLSRIHVLRGEEPWPGYDEQTVAEIEAVMNEGDYQRAQDVLVYERARKNRPEVVQSAIVPARFVLSTSGG